MSAQGIFMKIKIAVLKPRNRLVALALKRKAGQHRDRRKFDRRSQKSSGGVLDQVNELRRAGLL
jgi:hypothetical protein